MMHWDPFLVKYAIVLRPGIFVLVLGIFYYWENKACWRALLMDKKARWTRHLALGALSAVLGRLIFPTMVIGMAVIAEEKHIGLLANLGIPYALNVLLALMGLDLILYVQHRWLHRIGLFWRVHRVHHIDTALDASTGVRFHPIEYVFTMMVKAMAVLFLGAPVLAVFLFEVLVSIANLFVHSNIQLPARLEYFLRFIFVTPNMHRIHHSDVALEYNRNFGFIFSFWDKLLGTYMARSAQGEGNLVIGLELYRDPQYQVFNKILAIPFMKKPHKVLKQSIEKPARTTQETLGKNDKISE